MELSELRKEWRRLEFLWENNLDNYPKDRLRDYIRITELKAELKQVTKERDVLTEQLQQSSKS